MKVLDVRNVDEAYVKGLELIRAQGIPEDSRNGRVLVMPCPVATVYNRPTERVLFDGTRDANPFFHLIEAVWMLAGMNDATHLDRYVKTFSERYAEFDGKQHGAYGWRWVNHFKAINNQLLTIGQMLKDDPRTRRAVLTMWDPDHDLNYAAKDIPCNTHVYFHATFDNLDKIWDLNITVCCRSNDIVWGAYGANAVHMSIMGEVVAGLAGMRLGRYTQISNNYHMYDETATHADGYVSPYVLQSVSPWPVIDEHDNDSAYFLLLEAPKLFSYKRETISHPWLIDVVMPMMQVHAWYKKGNLDEAFRTLGRVKATDWQYAGARWLERRIAAKSERNTL